MADWRQLQDENAVSEFLLGIAKGEPKTSTLHGIKVDVAIIIGHGSIPPAKEAFLRQHYPGLTWMKTRTD